MNRNDFFHTMTQRKDAKQSSFFLFERLCKREQGMLPTYPTIHVGGTNGKGEVSILLAKGLELAGYRVGLFTSPHLVCFEERIQVNGKRISFEEIVAYDALLSSLEESDALTFFEKSTYYALSHFKKEQVDVAIFEVGLGGRLDATNVITPMISIITSIGWDHQDVLGNTLEAIAKEKGGIIKKGGELILGPNADYPILIEKAASLNVPVHLIASKATYMEENRAIVSKGLSVLQKKFPLITQKVIETTTLSPNPAWLPCRFERMGRCIFDVAHNVSAFSRLIEALDLHVGSSYCRYILGMCQDKDIEGVLDVLACQAKYLHIVSLPSTERSASLDRFQKKLSSLGVSHFTLEPSIEHALASALCHEETIVVCGSFYLMAEAKERLSSLSVSFE